MNPRPVNPVEVKPNSPSTKPPASGGSSPGTVSPQRPTNGGARPLPANPAQGDGDSGFKPTGPAPRDGRGGLTPRPSRGGFDDAPSAPDVTNRVSDRATRFSGVDAAMPARFDRGPRGGGGGGGGSNSRWNDRDDYWDGYRDGYRRGYRNGYWDGRWDDCWFPRHRHGWSWSIGYNSCWDGWSVSIGWGGGWDRCWSGPRYCAPVYYHNHYAPVYYSGVSYTTTSTWWGGGTTVTTTYSSAPRLEVVDFCDTICEPTTIVYASNGPRVVDINVQSFQPTVYRSNELAGVLSWNDTPESVVGTVGSAAISDRAGAAANFLGRVPAGGWDVGFEAEREVEGQRQLVFRGLSPNGRGQRVQVVLVPSSSSPRLYAGQRVTITGRVAEICVDDPYEQAGRVTVIDGSVKY